MSDRDVEDQPLLVNSSEQSSLSEVQQVTLKWENLNYTIDQEKPLAVLKNVSGFANPREILAIMGSSGSGKTSLLSILSQNLKITPNSHFSGDIFLNNIKKSNFNENRYIKFVMQESILYDFLTPYESLKFAVKLKLDNPKEGKDRINLLLHEFKLTSVAHSLIGNSLFKGLSGGEKKRVSIAYELISYPSILIMDEPTSGLDSFIANSIMQLIKNILKLGVTVIISIHQPSHSIYQMFDRMILMQEGRFVYQGPAKASHLYFQKLGFFTDAHINPTEYYMKLLRIEDRNNLAVNEKQVMETLIEGYKNSENKIWDDMKKLSLDENEISKIEKKTSFFHVLKWLLWREYIHYKRNYFLIVIKATTFIVFGVLVDIIFIDLGYDNKGMENRNGAISFYYVSLYFMIMFQHSVVIVCERDLVCKEISDKMYSVNTYLLSKLLFDLPIALIGNLIFVLII